MQTNPHTHSTHLVVFLQVLQEALLERLQLGHLAVEFPHGVYEGNLLRLQPVLLFQALLVLCARGVHRRGRFRGNSDLHLVLS